MRILLLFICLLFSFQITAEDLKVNAVALKNGAGLNLYPGFSDIPDDDFSFHKIKNGNPLCLIDERSDYVWHYKSEAAPHTFVIELSENYLLEKLVFDNTCKDKNAGICSKDIKVELSLSGPSSGFKEIGLYKLSPCLRVEYPIKVTEGRWLRITVLSNHGNEELTQLADFEAWGKPSEKRKKPFQIDGIWTHGDRWTSIERKDNGNIYGCFIATAQMLLGELWDSLPIKEHFFYLSGVEKNRSYNAQWRSDNGKRGGWMSFTINKEGTRISGVWGSGDNKNEFGIWYSTKNSGVPEMCGENIVTIRLLDSEKRKPISGQVKISDETESLKIDAGTGAIIIRDMYADSAVTIKVSSRGYLDAEKEFTLWKEEEEIFIILDKPKVGESIKFENILFEKAKSKMLPQAYTELEKITRMMLEYPDMEVELQGHTDNIGDPDRLIKLSEERVLEVKKQLIRKGIEAYRINTIGLGGSKPIADNGDEETRRLNRRVECKVLNL